MAVLHSALGLGVVDAVLAGVVFLVLRSGWKLKG
jgi:ABC-2 type transport system permease protein